MDVTVVERSCAPCQVHIVSCSPLFAQALACLAGSAGMDARANPVDCQSDPPDVLLVDSDMSDQAVIERSSALLARYPAARLVLLAKEANPQLDLLAARVGAVGVLTRSVGRAGLVDGIHAAAAGRAPAVPRRRDPHPSVHLTEREVAVIRLLAVGRSNAEIADELSISPNTVRTHVQNILNKLGASSRLNAVALARQCGLLGHSRCTPGVPA